MKKVKIAGERSIQSKLSRLAYELEHDAARIRGDHGSKYASLADAIKSISSTCGHLSRSIDH